MYEGDKPIFDKCTTRRMRFKRSLDRKSRIEARWAWYLIIDQTEAMTTVDINTGAFVGRHPEETIFNTNVEATQAIARQLRLCVI
ncbi:ribonuclease E/G [Vibrio lentus]|nr:ribonuclease E/G [Vibrio lentus]